MSYFDKVEFKSFVDEHKKVVKRIPFHREVSKSADKLKQYETDLIKSYNAIINYTRARINKCNQNDKEFARLTIIDIRQKLALCFGRIGCQVRIPHLPDLLQNIDSEILTDTEYKEVDSDETHETDNSDETKESQGTKGSYEDKRSKINVEILEKPQPTPSTSSNSEFQTENENSGNQKEQEEESRIMVLSQVDFLRVAAHTLSKNFSGNPLELTAFINSIKLLKTIAEDGNHHDFLKQFVLTKLEGKALEAIPAQPQSVDAIIEALQAAIRPDNSKVIAGRMTALQVRSGNYEEFTKSVETLSDAFRRALMVEGIPFEKAQEMTVDKTVELCRTSAKSPLVKSVLASTSFKTPNEVVAKLVVEQATETKEAQILAYKAQHKPNGRFNKYQRGGNYKNNRNNSRKNGNNGNGQNKYNNYNGNYYNQSRNGQPGRGNGRNRQGGQNSNWQQEHNVRYTNAENFRGPSQGWRADQNNQQDQNQQVRIPYQQN